MIDIQTINMALWQRLTVDASGSALRAALGAGASSIVMADDIRIEGLMVRTLPARPFVAFRRGPAPTIARVVRRPIYHMHCYDDPAVGYGRLDTLPALLESAFGDLVRPAAGAIGECELSTGPHARDAILDMLVVVVSITVGAI